MPNARRLTAAGVAFAGAALAGALAGPRANAAPNDPDGTKASPPAPVEVARAVDALMAEGWKAAGVEPRERASDAELFRRLHLDATGSIPDEDAVRGFLDSKSPKKWETAVRAALLSSGYARSMGLRWGSVLVGREYLLRTLQYRRAEQMVQALQGGMREGQTDGYAESDGPVPPLVAWLEERLARNAPWDEVARDLISASGPADENYATHFMLRYVRDGKAEELAGATARVFQGIQIQCAQCHDHPYTAWTQADFYGVAAFYARTAARREPPPPDSKRKQGPYVVFDRGAGQIRIPAPPGEQGRLILPRYLTGDVVPPGAAVDRRAELGRLVTGEKNPYFARATVNRVWSYFFGRGLVSPVDDLESTESLHPKVLEHLAADFRASGHDLRRLSEVILLTRAYQLTSAGPERGREPEVAAFARAPLRGLSAEQLFDSILTATGAEDIRTDDRRARARIERTKFALLRTFLQTFGDDEGEEAVDEGTIPQALLMLNGPLTNDAIRPRPGHPVYDRLFRMKDADARIDTIYLRALGRLPSPSERATVTAALEADAAKGPLGQAQAYADVFWSLLNSSEFVFNH